MTAPPIGRPLVRPVVYPIPPGRGRWRIGLHRRIFAPAPWQSTLIVEITGARGRRLEQSLNSPAKFTFTLDSRARAARLVRELQTDVYVWRWDDQAGFDRLMFRGIVAQSEDEVTENTNVVTFTAHDYLAMLGRRFYTSPVAINYLSVDQDDLAAALLAVAQNPRSSSGGTSFAPGSYLPLTVAYVNEDGSPRAVTSGRIRDRSYIGGQVIGEALDNLAACLDGFDYDCQPSPDRVSGVDALRIFYPHQGIDRDIPLAYPSTVAGLTRAVSSGDYGNYWRVLGDAGDDPVQLYGEDWNADSNDVNRIPVGLWQGSDPAPDVTIQQTLDDKAAGDLRWSGRTVPSYTLRLRPGAYTWGNPAMGDTVPLLIKAGRIDEATQIRVIGLAYSIGVDGDEDVEVTVGRPRSTLSGYLTQSDRAVDALTRRIGSPDEGLSPEFPRGFVAQGTGPAFQTDYPSAPSGAPLESTIFTVTASLLAGRRYRISTYGFATLVRIVPNDTAYADRMYLAWTVNPGGPQAFTFINDIAVRDVTSPRITGSGVSFVAPQINPGTLSVSMVIGITANSQTPGVLGRVGPNGCRITIEDIGG